MLEKFYVLKLFEYWIKCLLRSAVLLWTVQEIYAVKLMYQKI
jgi:hypothetical protein